MSCTVQRAILPKGTAVKVNGVAIARALIAREVQHHPARTPTDAWRAAAQALVVRELLLQEASRLSVDAIPQEDTNGRRETADEANIRALIDREVKTPEPDTATVQRYYEQNRRKFRSADLYECAHILFAASARDPKAYGEARASAAMVIVELEKAPERFKEFARTLSACPSAKSGGHLGQVTARDLTPEFARALDELAPGCITKEPIAARYGFHIIRLDRKVAGQELAFATVAERIAAHLKASVERRAIAQYLARLVSRAVIEGIALPDAQALRVS
jgi:peptidyl-prolyl cis-trans isomerase C